MLVFNNIIKNLSLIIITLLLMFFSLVSCTQVNDDDFMQTETAAESGELYLFDYENINIDTTSSIGTKIKNCNAYIDMYGDLIILGELENISGNIKTDIEMTIDLMRADSGLIHTEVVPVTADYLGKGAKYPFHYYYTEKEKYIELSTIKIGVNYREYHNDFEGNPIAEIEDYYYQKDYFIVEGRIINLGKEKIKDLRLLCTFYDNKDRVVFIKECYLPRERMMPGEEQYFTLKVFLDQYIKEFTDFHFEIFFEDEIRVNI